MGAMARNTVLVMFIWLMLAGVCLGKQVYLADGASIDCESFWQRDDKVVVKVNRDIIIDFDKNEIDIQKTFRQGAKGTAHLGVKKATGPGKSAKVATPATTTVAPVASSAATVAPAKPVPPPTVIPAPVAQQTTPPAAQPPAATDPATPPDKAELERRSKEAAAMMAEAIQKKDPELLKKAMAAQREAMGPNAVQPGGLGTKYLLLLLVICLLIVVSMWVVFERGGESGWKSLVPIYNMYILMVIAGKPGWWLLLLFVPIVGTVFYLMAMLSLAERFGRGALFGVGLFFLPMIFFPLLAFGGGAPAEA